MCKNEKIKMIQSAVRGALMQYDVDNVDIVRNEVSGMVDIMYHSRHNSFAIASDVCESDGLSESDINSVAERYDIGYCW